MAGKRSGSQDHVACLGRSRRSGAGLGLRVPAHATSRSPRFALGIPGQHVRPWRVAQSGHRFRSALSCRRRSRRARLRATGALPDRPSGPFLRAGRIHPGRWLRWRSSPTRSTFNARLTRDPRRLRRTRRKLAAWPIRSSRMTMWFRWAWPVRVSTWSRSDPSTTRLTTEHGCRVSSTFAPRRASPTGDGHPSHGLSLKRTSATCENMPTTSTRHAASPTPSSMTKKR